MEGPILLIIIINFQKGPVHFVIIYGLLEKKILKNVPIVRGDYPVPPHDDCYKHDRIETISMYILIAIYLTLVVLFSLLCAISGYKWIYVR